MTLPQDLTTITVTADYSTGGGFSGGAPVPGLITFTPSAQLADTVGHVIIPAAPIPMELSGGTGAVVLLCTDNTNLTPAGWSWTITQSAGSATLTWTGVMLPHTLGATVSLDQLIDTTPA